MKAQHTVTAHLFLVFACVAWGGSLAVGRFGLSEGSAIWLTLWRWGPGGVIFAIYLAMRWGQIGPTIQQNIATLTFISLLGVVIYPATLFLAVAQTTVLNASLYLAAAPALIVLVSVIFWKDRVGLVGSFALLLSLAGALVLMFRGDFAALAEFQMAVDDIWAIVSALAWVGYCTSLPLKPKELNEVGFLAAIVVIGSLLLLVFAGFQGFADIPLPDSPVTAWSMAYFALFPSLFAFIAWNWGTAILGPSIAAPYINLVPFLGGALGIIFLNEGIESYHVVGGALIITSLILNGLRR